MSNSKGVSSRRSTKRGWRTVRNSFTNFRSFEGWWERAKPSLFPEFVEWVEEQRSQAA